MVSKNQVGKISVNTLDFLLASLVTASKALKSGVKVRRSFLVERILSLLYKEGYISGFAKQGACYFWVDLKYIGMDPVIHHLERCSLGSRMVSASSFLLRRKYGLKRVVVSTPKGIVFGFESGGIPLFFIN